MSISAPEPRASVLDARSERAPYFSHKPRAARFSTCSNDRLYEAPSRPPPPTTTTTTTGSKPPRRPVSCAGTPPVAPQPFPLSPSHHTLESYRGFSSSPHPHPQSPQLVLERSSSRESPVLHRDDGSTWRLVERVTEVFVVDVGPPTSPLLPRRRSPPPPEPASPPPSRLDDLDDPDRTPRRPSTRHTTRARTPSPSPATLSPRLAALAHTLRTLDDAERSRQHRAALPRSPSISPAVEPRTTSTSDVVLAHELGSRLEGLGTLFPGGVPRAVGLEADDDDGWDGQALRSAWSATSDEDEVGSGSEYGEAEEGRSWEGDEEDESRTSSGSSPSFVSDGDDDDASRRGSRDSWQSAATTVSAHSASKGGARRKEVEREADQACRRWRAWGAS